MASHIGLIVTKEETIIQVKKDIRIAIKTQLPKLNLVMGQTNTVSFILGKVEILEPQKLYDLVESFLPVYTGAGNWMTNYGEIHIGRGHTFFMAIKEMKE